MDTTKINEVLELGFDLLRSGRFFNLVSTGQARKNAALAFVGGTLVGGAVATVLLMRGDTATQLKGRVGDITGNVVSKAGDFKRKVTGEVSPSLDTEPPRAS